jgi:hypothetical protein
VKGVAVGSGFNAGAAGGTPGATPVIVAAGGDGGVAAALSGARSDARDVKYGTPIEAPSRPAMINGRDAMGKRLTRFCQYCGRSLTGG